MRILLLLALLLPTISFAAENKKPIEISSDTLEVDEAKNLAEFAGNVIVVQDGSVIKSGRLKVHYAGKGDKKTSNNIKLIEFLEGVNLKNPNDETASGKYGTYDMVKDIITINQNVRLTQKGNILTGDKLIYNKKTGKSQVFSNGKEQNKDGRVKVIFNRKK